ncbi:MAG: SpoIIE family protein phosphatase [Planctomycetes bacterium]|nr:SpoIIE family protein phosphatase [Planctomycetota bacterium]
MDQPRRGLRRKLMLLSGVVMFAMAVVMVSASWFGYARIWNFFLQSIRELHNKMHRDNLNSAQTHWRNILSQYSLEIVHDIDATAGSIETHARFLAALDLFGADRELTRKIVADVGQENPQILYLMYAWEDGDFAYANQAPAEGYDPRRRDWYQKAMATHPYPYWTPIYQDHSTGVNLVSCAIAFREPDGTPRGALSIDFKRSELLKKVLEHERKGHIVFLLDEKLSFILPEQLPSGEILQDRALADVFADDPARGRAMAELAAGRAGTWEFSMGNHQMLVSLTPSRVSNWTVGVAMPLADVNSAVMEMTKKTDDEFRQLESQVLHGGWIIAGIMLAAMAFILLASLIWLQRNVAQSMRPLEELSEGVRLLGRGDLALRLPQGGDAETHTLSQSFNTMIEDLERHIRLLQEETDRSARVEKELQLGRDIQKGLLPAKFPGADEPYALYALMRPAQQVGGDLYDFAKQGNQLYVAVADVSGKGVAAGLFMSVVKTLFRGMVRNELAPEDILRQINEQLAEQNPEKMFVTMCIGALDLSSRRLRYASAGHWPPLMAADGTNYAALPCLPALPLGLAVPVAYQGQETLLMPGSRFLLYTDGVTEAVNPAHEFFELDNLLSAMRQTGGLSPRESLEILWDTVSRFSGTAEAGDDITLLLLENKN